MEDQSNFNPHPVAPSYWKKHGRKTLLIIGGIILASALLVGTGGFEKLARIFGLKASTIDTIELSGETNLRGGVDATESHIETSTQATLIGADVVTTADKIPDGDLPGFIVPDFLGDIQIPCEPSSGEDCPETIRRYVSPVLNLGAEANTLESIRIRAYLPPGASMLFDYRVSDTIAGLEPLEFIPIETVFDPAESPDEPVISTSQTTLPSVAVSQYLQVGVTFISGGMLGPVVTLRPAVYGWSIEYAQADTGSGDGSGDGTGGGTDEPPADPSASRTIVLRYDPNYVPTDATIRLIPADTLVQSEVLTANFDMTSQREIQFEVANMPSGAYALDVSGDGFHDGVLAILAGGSSQIELILDNMTTTDTCPAVEPPADSGEQTLSADLNGDGVVSSSDLTILLGQYGEATGQ